MKDDPFDGRTCCDGLCHQGRNCPLRSPAGRPLEYKPASRFIPALILALAVWMLAAIVIACWPTWKAWLS